MKISKVCGFTILMVLFFTLGISVNGYSATADEVLRKMDDHRLINNSCEMMIRVESYINDSLKGSTLMKGFINNGRMTSLIFLEPLNMKDRKIVIKDNDMWFIIPKVKNPIRVTPSQRLMGGITYSDVAGTSYAEGYIPKINGEEEIAGLNSDGSKSDASRCFVLELSAKDARTNYNKIITWVDEQNFLPVKADFFALSGKKIMTAYYASPKEWDGKIIITKMFLFDQINIRKHFSMEYFDIKAIQINDNGENS